MPPITIPVVINTDTASITIDGSAIAGLLGQPCCKYAPIRPVHLVVYQGATPSPGGMTGGVEIIHESFPVGTEQVFLELASSGATYTVQGHSVRFRAAQISELSSVVNYDIEGTAQATVTWQFVADVIAPGA